MVLQSLAGLPAFLGYFCTLFVVVAAIVYLGVYALTTPHDAFALIRGGGHGPVLFFSRSPSESTTPAADAATRRRGFNSIGRVPSGG
jgi:hypothetical protein